jgi:hypothetical protein
MKLRLAVPALLALFFTVTAATSAQTPPPIKMGLWEHDVTVQMSGMPDGMASSRSVASQSCYTPNTWKYALQNMQNRRQVANTSCTTSNMEQDPRHVSFDMVCTVSGRDAINTTFHIDMQFDSDEAMHGTTTANMSGPNMPQGMTMTSTIKSKFVGPDCGDVKPPEVKDAPPAATPPS